MLLNVHSYYSLRYGTLSLETLIKNALHFGYDTLVLTDINNSAASLDFIIKTKEAGIKGLAGMEFREEGVLRYVGIAKNERGFKELNDWMTYLNAEKRTCGSRAPVFEEVFIVYPFGTVQSEELSEQEYIGIAHDNLNTIALQSSDIWQYYVVWHPISFGIEEEELHRQLRAIDFNILISQLDDKKCAKATEHFIEKEELLKHFSTFPILIENTKKILEACSFLLDFKGTKTKKSFTGNKQDDKKLLEKYALEGFSTRYESDNIKAKERLEKELRIIDELHFSSYFLITDDICRYARNRSFHYVGRGSGANSIVAYCLRITEVCPVTLDLYFERFLNPKRKSPPDFDIDFSWKDRDAIYTYIFNRYQTTHTALMGAMSTFKDRSILRELGKIYGLPKPDIDRLIREPESFLNENEVVKKIVSTYTKLQDFPNQRTIHASGVLISEEPLTCYSALDYPPKGLPTVQYDMYVAEDIGFEKFDILSQRGLGHIKDCCELVFANTGIRITSENPKRFFEDPEIATRLRNADTVGCFYIESPAMRQLISKLQCDDYLTLVAASSIIRPGVASSGMMQTYIERHHNPEKVSYLHPVFKEQLEETYGVMVYQEDVMKIGHHFGGLDLADADVLRRMMSGKYRNKNHLKEIEEKYFSYCQSMGYSQETASEVWRQMESFAGYSFNKAHSASFAVESYQSLYLKTYFPLEFMVSVLNNYGGFYSREVYINEAKRAGGIIELPCINNSQFQTSLHEKKVYLGFDVLLNLEERLTKSFLEERSRNGVYVGLEDFLERTSIGLEQVVILIRCGAFRFLKKEKKNLLWEVHLLWRKKQKRDISNTTSLFAVKTTEFKLPYLQTDVLENIYDEVELLGFPVSGTFFDLAKSNYRGNVEVTSLVKSKGQQVRIVAYLVAYKTVKTKTGKYMKFGTFIDYKGKLFDTVHFPQSLQNYPLTSNGLFLIEGKVVVDYSSPSIEVQKCARMPLKADPRSV